MIRVKLTENYTGFNIEGTFDDFNELYDSIYYFLGWEECPNLLEEDMRLHILAFLYDLRHAYQGSRNVKAVDNWLSDEVKEYYGIKKGVKQDILYDFNYLLPELLLDITIFKHFAIKTGKDINNYNTDYNVVMTFYSKIINSLSEILTPIQLKKAKNLLASSTMSEKFFLRQWFMVVSETYINMTKTKRKKELMHTLDAICNYYLYDGYDKVRKEILKYAKEHDCKITEVEYGDFPVDITW